MCMSPFYFSRIWFKQARVRAQNIHTFKEYNEAVKCALIKHTMYTCALVLFHPFLYISHTLGHYTHRCPRAHTNTTYATEHMPPLTGKQYYTPRTPPSLFCLYIHTHLDLQTPPPPPPPTFSSYISTHTKLYFLYSAWDSCTGCLHTSHCPL